MADEYNIKIAASAQLDEIKALLEELSAISAEISKINGLGFSAVNLSMSELSKTSNGLVDALVANTKASEALTEATSKASEGTKTFRTETEKTKKEVDSIKAATQGFYMELGATAARMASQLPSSIMRSIQAFGQQEMAVQKLASAIRSQGGSVSEVLPIMQNFATEIQRITTYGDEQVLAMQAMAMATGVAANQMDECIKGAIGLSNAFGLGLNEAVKAAAAVIQGKSEKLNELIPTLSKCKTASERLALAQKAMSDGFAQAKTEVETSIGKIKQAANAWGDLTEVVGGIFAPVAIDVASLLKSMCEILSENNTVTAILTGSLTSAAVALSFAKIGGLANVAGLFKNLGLSILGVKTASDALNMSIKANPIVASLTIAIAAVTGLASAYSYFKGKSEETYKANIEKSKEYCAALDEEMEHIKQWGLTNDANRKRVKELNWEIKKYETLLEQSKTRVFGETMEELTIRTDNYKVRIQKCREFLKLLSGEQDLNKRATDKAADAQKRSEEILKKLSAEMEATKSKTAELTFVQNQYTEAKKRSDQLKKNLNNVDVSERVAKTSEYAEITKQLVELQAKELKLILEVNAAENETKKSEVLKKQYAIEKQIDEAVANGETEKAKGLKAQLEIVKAAQEKLTLANAYIDSQKSTIKNQNDLKKLQEEADAYADSILKKKKVESDTEKWLTSHSENSKKNQQGLEIAILQAQSAGNKERSKKLEGELRIAQLTNEIFENTRKEGISATELEALHQKAIQDAQSRYGLEKSIADEKERQTLATDAQAKAEDILLTNKIEQLKAEGKLTEAKELEREREIKRTLAGMKGVSEDDKKKLANVMRQTNDYRDKQEEKRSQGGSTGGSRGGFDSDVSSAVSRKNSMRSGGSGGGILSSGRNNREKGRPATVSDKYADKYAQFQEAKKNGTLGKDKFGKTMGWNDFRDSKVDTKKQARANAKGILDGAEKTAKGIGSRVKLAGDTAEAAKSAEQAPRKVSKPTPPEKPKQAASSALNNKLEQMNASPKKDGNNKENPTETILKEIKTALNSIDQNVKSLGTKKDKN